LEFNDFAENLAVMFIPALHSATVKEIKTHCSDISSADFRATQQLPDESATEESAEETKLREKKKESASYDDPDEEDKNSTKPAENDLFDVDEEDFDAENEVDKSSASVPKVAEKPKKKTTKKKKTDKSQVSKEEKNLEGLRYLHSYGCHPKENKITIKLQVPASDKKLLMVSLVERVADSYIVNSIPGIEQAYIEHKEGKYYIITNGVNIPEMWNFEDRINVHDIKCNHIHNINTIYGIEAARGCLISEIKGVFGAYGIKVDPRHLSLVADYMTFTGSYKACNRIHMDAKASPWLKMSFETTMKFLSETALVGGFDPIRSPSANIVVGNPAGVGSAFMDIRHPLV